MALQGEIMKYVGNELMNVGSKGLAKAGSSALSSLIPKVATKAVTPVATDVATKSVLGSVLPANDTIDLFRGQLKGNDNFYYNKGDGTKGSATVGNGLYMTPNEAKTAPWRGEGIEPIKITANKADLLTKDELVSKTKWANDILNDNNAMMEMWQKDPQQAELVEALSLGHLPEVSKYLDKPFIQPDSGQGEELAETIFFPDTRPELTEQYRKDLYNRANNITPAVPKTTNNLGYSVNEFGRLADKSGKPVTFYHSTPAEFSEFDDAMLGRNTEAPNTAFGHFVTTDKDFSSRFKDINNEGLNGRTMELQARVSNPITHPYMAGQKYTDPAQLDKIVEDYYKAIGAEDSLDTLREYAADDGQSLYDEYMDMTLGEDPFEFAGDERQTLLDNGYDAVEIIEGPKSGLVEGSTDDTPVSSLAVLEGKNLRQNRNIPVSAIEGATTDIPVNKSVMDKVAKYLKSPTDANADGVINWNDVKAVYNQAKQQQAELDKMGRAIAEKEGFPEYTDFSPKSIESMENKVKRKGGDYSLASMKDHTRNKIMMNSWEDVPKVISDMEQMGLSPDVEFVLNDWGYKGLHITGRFDNGLGWEIQLTTPEDWPRKLKSDAIYDKWRNTQLDTASPKEVMGYLNAMRESKAMWSESKIPDLSMYDNVTGR